LVSAMGTPFCCFVCQHPPGMRVTLGEAVRASPLPLCARCERESSDMNEAGMSETTARRLRWAGFIVVTGIYSVGLGLSAVSGSPDLFGLATFAFPLMGLVILSRQPKNRIAWILLGIGLAWAVSVFTEGYARYGIEAHPGWLPRPDLAAVVGSSLWAPPIGLMGIYLILLFPDGRLPSPRWRAVAWLGGIAIAGTITGIYLAPGTLGDVGYPNLRNPLGVEGLKPFTDVLVRVFVLLLALCVAASAVSLVLRYRRSRGIERLQLKWLAATAGVVAGLAGLANAVSVGTSWFGPKTPGWVEVVQSLEVFSFLLIPTAIGFAVLKYRLYDIDVVINKAVLFAALAAFITAVYVAIVVGIGSAIGLAEEPNLALSIVATAVVAVAFQPVRERLQRLSNRLVYGKRATPYEVLSDFASRMGSTYAAEDLLPRMARILAEGTGAKEATVWLTVGNELKPEATWPSDEPPAGVRLSEGELPELEATLALPVHYRGELLGALSLTKPPRERLSPAEEKLARDLASQAGLVLRNVRLTEELLERLKELQASRQRIVAAQDEERRRLERNLHDGAQQQLVALQVQLRLVEQLVPRDADKALGLVRGVQDAARAALEDLRNLARGIYPPLLADQGLIAALTAQASRSPVPVTVLGGGAGRYRRDVESAVYFCTLEALNNVAKYADATAVTVRVSEDNGVVRFRIDDDGRGFDPRLARYGTGVQGMVDRLDALGGSLEISSEPGRGTSVEGVVPIERT
jgi:signal transduction histidine kinase